MPLSDSDVAAQARAELARHAINARWANTTPEQRRDETRKARLAGAVSTVCKRAEELDADQRARILTALTGGEAA